MLNLYRVIGVYGCAECPAVSVAETFIPVRSSMHEGHPERSVVGAESFQEIELGLLSWKSLASQRAGCVT